MGTQNNDYSGFRFCVRKRKKNLLLPLKLEGRTYFKHPNSKECHHRMWQRLIRWVPVIPPLSGLFSNLLCSVFLLNCLLIYCFYLLSLTYFLSHKWRLISFCYDYMTWSLWRISGERWKVHNEKICCSYWDYRIKCNAKFMQKEMQSLEGVEGKMRNNSTADGYEVNLN